jgi:predicted nucleic acid-binding Zn ribbon protein
MITDKDFELICNYKSQEVNSAAAKVYCMEMIEENNKQIIRDLAIDSILSNDKKKDEAYNNYRSIISNISEYPVISPKLTSETIFKQKYVNLSDIYDYIMQDLESCTNGGDVLQLTNQKNLTDKENFSANSRRIITKIISKYNNIYKNARMPATCVIVGSNLIPYLHDSSAFCINNHNAKILIGSVYGVNIIVNYTINPNKVIIIANSDNMSNGLSLIVDEKNKDFFYAKLPSNSWSKNIDFFEIK